MTGTKIGHGRKGINAVEDGNKRCPVRTLKHRAFCDGPLSKLALIIMKRRLVLRCFGRRIALAQVALSGSAGSRGADGGRVRGRLVARGLGGVAFLESRWLCVKMVFLHVNTKRYLVVSLYVSPHGHLFSSINTKTAL